MRPTIWPASDDHHVVFSEMLATFETRRIDCGRWQATQHLREARPSIALLLWHDPCKTHRVLSQWLGSRHSQIPIAAHPARSWELDARGTNPVGCIRRLLARFDRLRARDGFVLVTVDEAPGGSTPARPGENRPVRIRSARRECLDSPYSQHPTPARARPGNLPSTTGDEGHQPKRCRASGNARCLPARQRGSRTAPSASRVRMQP